MSGCGKRLQENFDISVLSELTGTQRLVVHEHECSYSSDEDFGLDGYGYNEAIYRQSMAKFMHGFQTYQSLQVSDCSISYSRCKESISQFHQRNAGTVDWVQPEPHISMLPMTRNTEDGLLPNVSELHLLNNHSKSNKKSGMLPDFKMYSSELSVFLALIFLFSFLGLFSLFSIKLDVVFILIFAYYSSLPETSCKNLTDYIFCFWKDWNFF